MKKRITFHIILTCLLVFPASQCCIIDVIEKGAKNINDGLHEDPLLNQVPADSDKAKLKRVLNELMGKSIEEATRELGKPVGITHGVKTTTYSFIRNNYQIDCVFSKGKLSKWIINKRIES